MQNIKDAIDNIGASINLFEPELTLTALFLLLIIIDICLKRKNRDLLCTYLSLVFIAISLFFNVWRINFIDEAGFINLFSNSLSLSPSIILFKTILLILGFTIVLFGFINRKNGSQNFTLNQYLIILTAAMLGLNLMAMSANLLTIYISIEIVSVSGYVLVAGGKQNPDSVYAGMRYLIFGAASSAVMLYGMSLIYGITGTTYIYAPEFSQKLVSAQPYSFAIVTGFIFCGLFFKITAWPLHIWAPDVYKNCPASVIAFLSVASKTAGFAIMLNIIKGMFSGYETIPNILTKFQSILLLAGIITMTFGNFSALAEKNIKKLIAFSSIGHTGLLLMILAAQADKGAGILLFYIIAYSLGTIVLLLFVSYLEEAFGVYDIGDLCGLGPKTGLLGVCSVIIIASLVGLPPTVGFIGKFMIVSALLDTYSHSDSYLLLSAIILALINTLVSLFYYIKIPMNLFLHKVSYSHNERMLNLKGIYTALITALTIAVIVLGLYPQIIKS